MLRVVCDLETSRMGAPYIYDISRPRVKHLSVNSKTVNNYKLRTNLVIIKNVLLQLHNINDSFTEVISASTFGITSSLPDKIKFFF